MQDYAQKFQITPAPVRTRIFLQLRSSLTASDIELMWRRRSLLGGSLTMLTMICQCKKFSYIGNARGILKRRRFILKLNYLPKGYIIKVGWDLSIIWH